MYQANIGHLTTGWSSYRVTVVFWNDAPCPPSCRRRPVWRWDGAHLFLVLLHSIWCMVHCCGALRKQMVSSQVCMDCKCDRSLHWSQTGGGSPCVAPVHLCKHLPQSGPETSETSSWRILRLGWVLISSLFSRKQLLGLHMETKNLCKQMAILGI